MPYTPGKRWDLGNSPLWLLPIAVVLIPKKTDGKRRILWAFIWELQPPHPHGRLRVCTCMNQHKSWMTSFFLGPPGLLAVAILVFGDCNVSSVFFQTDFLLSRNSRACFHESPPTYQKKTPVVFSLKGANNSTAICTHFVSSTEIWFLPASDTAPSTTAKPRNHHLQTTWPRNLSRKTLPKCSKQRTCIEQQTKLCWYKAY